MIADHPHHRHNNTEGWHGCQLQMQPRAPVRLPRDGESQARHPSGFDLHRIQIATNHHAQVIGHELHDMVTFTKFGYLEKLGWPLDFSMSPSIDIRPSLRTLANKKSIAGHLYRKPC